MWQHSKQANGLTGIIRETYQSHGDAKTGQGTTAMPGKATGLPINAFHFLAYNNLQLVEIKKIHNTDLTIFLRKSGICLIYMMVVTKEMVFCNIYTWYQAAFCLWDF